MRSWLYVPGDDQRKVEKAARSTADVVILDLEDGVSEARKDVGRSVVGKMLAELDFGRSRRFVRVNQDRWSEDAAATIPSRPDGFVIPKASSPSEVEEVVRSIREMAKPRTVDIALIVTEDAAGVLAMAETMSASAPTAVMWGTEDLSASLGASTVKDDDGALLPVFSSVLATFLLTAAARGVPAVDTPWLDLEDSSGLSGEALASARQGFAGKQAIHPGHLDIINTAFTPTPEAVDEARRLSAAFEDRGGGAFRFEGRMVDAPHLARALRILAAAENLDVT